MIVLTSLLMSRRLVICDILLLVCCLNIACIFIHRDTEISTLIHIGRCHQLLVECFIHYQRHALELMGFNVAVKKPEPRIIRQEINHDIPSGRKNHCILSDCFVIDAEIWFVALDWLCTDSRIASFISALLIFTRYVSVELLDESSVWIIVRISDVNNMECMAMYVYWMGNW